MATKAKVDLIEQGLDNELWKLYSATVEQDSRVAAAHKTVATFAALTNKKLWLKNSPDAYTTGNEIGAPYRSKYFYQLVEHEIAHILFKSNFKAKELFSNEYTEQVRKAVETHTTKKLSREDIVSLSNCVGMVVNIVEDHRIHSLWSLLYPGSYMLLMEAGYAMLKPSRDAAHDDLISYFLQVAYDMPDVPAGRMDRFRPAMVSALKKVERKGPESTFIVCKWLMTQLVSELIRMIKGEPPPQDAGSAQITTDISMSMQCAGKSAANSDDNTAKGDSNPASGSAQKTGADWNPPPVQADAKDRVQALEDLLKMAKSQDPKQGEARMRRQLEDVRSNPRSEATKTAEKMVQQAMETDVNDYAALQQKLEDSADLMAAVMDKLEDALQAQQRMTEDEWITRDVGAKVALRDVTVNTTERTPMRPEDTATAQRLKQLFSQVHSRKTKALSDYGAEVDVEAFIANRVGKTQAPVFKQEQSGRGFKTLILLDRSASMQGSRSRQVERGSKILRKALDLPYVSFETWGFQSKGSEVILTRVPKNVDIEGVMPVYGQTPLHVAMRTAVNYMGNGTEKKQIIVLTDGEPNFSTKEGRSYSTKQLFEKVADETARARKQGINVTALGIGNAINDDDMKVMFGDRKNWLQVRSSERLGESLVRLVTTSFMQYLKNG